MNENKIMAQAIDRESNQIKQTELTPEEEFLSSILEGRDLSDLKDPNHEREVSNEAFAHLSEEQQHYYLETKAMKTVIADIRERSKEGLLTTNDYWGNVNLVPEHITNESFSDLFLTIISTSADPRINPSELIDDTEAEESSEFPEVPEALIPDEILEIMNEDMATPEWDVKDIKILEGSESYLYSTNYMTDNFAHWSFLAAEEDDVLTLVDNVRTESKIYPRPMNIRSLSNKPYFMNEERVLEAYKLTMQIEKYQDIQTCSASNGDFYFYSTQFLSEPQARALAEWISVESKLNL